MWKSHDGCNREADVIAIETARVFKLKNTEHADVARDSRKRLQSKPPKRNREQTRIAANRRTPHLWFLQEAIRDRAEEYLGGIVP